MILLERANILKFVMLQPCAGCFQLGAYMEGMMMGIDLDSFVMLLLSFFFKVDFNR